MHIYSCRTYATLFVWLLLQNHCFDRVRQHLHYIYSNWIKLNIKGIQDKTYPSLNICMLEHTEYDTPEICVYVLKLPNFV